MYCIRVGVYARMTTLPSKRRMVSPPIMLNSGQLEHPRARGDLQLSESSPPACIELSATAATSCFCLFYHQRRELTMALLCLTRDAVPDGTNTQDKLAGWGTLYGLAQFADATLNLCATYPIAFNTIPSASCP